jgi:DNA-directed RNA polymerase subunit L
LFQLADASEHTGTVVLNGEDHTLGNSLRYVLSHQPGVDFVGYSVPHPSENKIHLRIQTKSIKSKGSSEVHHPTLTESLVGSLDFLSEMCDVMSSKLDQAEENARKQGIKQKTKPDPTEKDLRNLVKAAEAEQERVRKQHENTNMEEQD